MEKDLFQHAASLFAAAVTFILLNIFFYVMLPMVIAVIFTGFLVILAQSVGANTETQEFTLLVLFTFLVNYAKIVEWFCDNFIAWLNEAFKTLTLLKKEFCSEKGEE